MLVVVFTVRVDVAEPPELRLSPEGDSVAVGPLGETETDSDTKPVKPPMLLSVMLEVVDEPGVIVEVVGLVNIEKLAGTTTRMLSTKVDQQFPDQHVPVELL